MRELSSYTLGYNWSDHVTIIYYNQHHSPVGVIIRGLKPDTGTTTTTTTLPGHHTYLLTHN